MRVAWLVVVFCTLLVSLPATAQQTATTVTRDPQATSVVQTAIATMGGAASLSQVQNSVVTATIVYPTAQESNQQSSTETFKWTYAGSEFRLEDSGVSGSHVLVSSGGSPQDFHDGAWFDVSPVAVRTNLPYHVPALALFSEIQNAGYSFVFVGSATLNGKTAIHIQTRDDSDVTGHLFTPQDWYFDPVTGLPLRVEYQIPISQNPTDSLRASMDFSSFQAVSGILVPFQLSIMQGPVSLGATISSAVFNTTVNAAGFAPSTAGAQ